MPHKLLHACWSTLYCLAARFENLPPSPSCAHFHYLFLQGWLEKFIFSTSVCYIHIHILAVGLPFRIGGLQINTPTARRQSN